MTRSIMCGLLAVLSVGALGILPVACQTGGVGDPCTPEDEYSATFGGFDTKDANIESRSFQCATRICLVNHFQGRVSCPLGQDGGKQVPCNGPSDGTCAAQGLGSCVASDVFSPTCNTTPDCPGGLAADGKTNLLGFVCTGGACQCTRDAMIDSIPYYCQPAPGGTSAQVLQSFVCHKPNNCQSAGASNTDNNGKDCCVPGTDTPVGVSVCGQCDTSNKRNAANAVYCSCRCCAPCCPAGTSTAKANQMGCSNDMSTCGSACDPNFNYCSCPNGYTCTNIREYVGLGDQNLAGAYCVINGTDYESNPVCTPPQPKPGETFTPYTGGSCYQ